MADTQRYVKATKTNKIYIFQKPCIYDNSERKLNLQGKQYLNIHVLLNLIRRKISLLNRKNLSGYWQKVLWWTNNHWSKVTETKTATPIISYQSNDRSFTNNQTLHEWTWRVKLFRNHNLVYNYDGAWRLNEDQAFFTGHIIDR